MASWMNENNGESRSRSQEYDSKMAEEIAKKFNREMNKRLRTIHEDEGIDYGPDVDDKTLAERHAVAVKIRRLRVKAVLGAIPRSRWVEFCFLVDATGSMQPHIDEVRKSIQNIVDKLTAGNKEEPIVQEIKFALVAYRDHGDSNQFEILDFTKSIDDFKQFSLKITATGGADAPEDVFGGLEKALELKWSENAGTKVIFHICDAPCHGREFHDNLGDDYPAGDPNKRTHTSLFKKIADLGIQYHFGKINSSTDIMLKKFSEAYNEPILDFDVSDVANISGSVMASVSASVSTSIKQSKAMGGAVRKERSYTLDTAEPDWNKLIAIEGICISYDRPTNISAIVHELPMNRRTPSKASFKIAVTSFAKGAERLAYYGKNLTTGKDIVLKEFLHLGRTMDSAERHELFNQMQTTAGYLATEFTKALEEKMGKENDSFAAIDFVKVQTIGIPSSEGHRFLTCEQRFSDKFHRFTNNAFYELSEKEANEKKIPIEMLQETLAFSHWTYKATNGYLMVVDLEGICCNVNRRNRILLTDPAIHCNDLSRFGKMNHGKAGIHNFFLRHVCNLFCKELQLEKARPDVWDHEDDLYSAASPKIK